MKALQKHAFDAEMLQAKHQMAHQHWQRSLYHLERAHVIGQNNVWPHIQVHALMLNVELRRRRPVAAFGQVIRIVLGTLGSAIGVVPRGNTGGSDVSLFKPMPIPADLQRVIDGEQNNAENHK